MKNIAIATLACLLAASAPAAEPFFVDLTKAANTDLEDDGIAGNGKGGWTDEGINDMHVYPPLPTGEVSRNGYRFKLIDPKANGGRGVIVLKGRRLTLDRPASVTVTVPKVRRKHLYVLQHATLNVPRQPANYLVATYTVKYADGSAAAIPIRDGKEIRQWWSRTWFDNSGAASWPIFMGRNTYSMKWRRFVGVWAMQWANPHPDKPIVSVTFASAGKAVPIIFAVTLADEDYYRGPDVKKHYKRPADVPAGYFDAKVALENRRVFAEMVRAGCVKGLRRLEVIRSDLLAVTVDAGFGRIGAGAGEKIAAGLQKPERFAVAGRPPVKVARLSYEYWNGNVGPFPQCTLYWHTYYLFLSKPMASGRSYKVVLNGMDRRFKGAETLRYDERTTPTPVIKINQVAYSSRAKRRYAYLGWWAGDAGAVDYSALKAFEVIDEKTGQPALTGDIETRRADDPLSGENVHQMDLSALKPGKYHIVVAGLGRSDSFGVGGRGIRRLYVNTGRAFYHQRCGHELKEPYTTFAKPACHLRVYEGGHLVGSKTYVPKPGERVREFRGGYHDAADFDVFTYHLRATALALSAYEFAPERFKDGDWNIPESGNGIPDVLDEADWALLGYRGLQRPDGAVPLGRGNDQDYIRGLKGPRPAFGVLPPESTSASEYAAVAAQYARLVRKYDAERARKYMASARKAFAWAKANPNAGGSRTEKAGKPFMFWAAVELYSATGDDAYHDELKKRYRDGAVKRIHWQVSQYVPLFGWSYILSRRDGVDKEIQKGLGASIVRAADHRVKQTELPAYRMGAGPKSGGLGWGNGNGGGHYAGVCLRAYLLTKQQKYLDTACLNADFQLGANPLGKTFITGMGARRPLHPQISGFLYTGPQKTGRTVAGITIYGLSSRQPGWYPKPTPPWRRWRDLGNGGAEVSSEFTVTETVGYSALLYGMLQALEP